MTLLDLLVLLLIKENNLEITYEDEHANVQFAGDSYCASLLEKEESEQNEGLEK
jgi:hypothetical protein